MHTIHELPPAALANLAPLFAALPTHHIAHTACQGLVPCRAFADNPDHPTAAVLSLERMGIAFAAGDAAYAPALLDTLRGWHPWYEINEPPADWYPALAAWSPKGHATVRYAFANDPASFDLDALRRMAAPPEGCEIRPYDAQLAALALGAQWSEDQTGTFASTEDFLARGFGMALLKDGQLLSGCSSFCRHPDGYEIQVDTHPDHRGQGLATTISAAFLLAVLARGEVPYWDAANAGSLRLAQRLGFVFTHAYPAWILVTPQESPEAVDAQVVG